MAPQQLSISFKQQLLLTAIAISVAITASVVLSALVITRFVHPETMQSFMPTAMQSAYQQPMNNTTNQNAQQAGSCQAPQEVAPADTAAAPATATMSQFSLTSTPTFHPHHAPLNHTTNVNSQNAGGNGQSSTTQNITNNTTNTTSVNSGNVVGSYNSHDSTKIHNTTITDSFNHDSHNTKTVVIKDNGNIGSYNKVDTHVTTNVDSNNTAINSGNTVDTTNNTATVDKSALVEVNQG